MKHSHPSTLELKINGSTILGFTGVVGCLRYSLHNVVFAGCEVILGSIDKGQSEIEHQVDEKRANALSKEHLTDGRKRGDSMSCVLFSVFRAYVMEVEMTHFKKLL